MAVSPRGRRRSVCEVVVILGDTPLGTKSADAGKYIRLVMLANDCTLRNLVPDELAKSFGFFQSKPATAFPPFAVTPDELPDWRDGRLHASVRSTYNGEVIGDCEAAALVGRRHQRPNQRAQPRP